MLPVLKKLPVGQVSSLQTKMKLVVALAASAAAFTGPAARLPSANVGRTLQAKAQPAMLLGGLRARANKALVPCRVRDVAIKHQRGLSRVKPLDPSFYRSRREPRPPTSPRRRRRASWAD